jgi:hypothetical protein
VAEGVSVVAVTGVPAEGGPAAAPPRAEAGRPASAASEAGRPSLAAQVAAVVPHFLRVAPRPVVRALGPAEPAAPGSEAG